LLKKYGHRLKQLKIVMAYSTDGLTRQLINGFDPTPKILYDYKYSRIKNRAF